MSFATVYNTLDALTAAGLIWPIIIEGGTSHFDPNTDRHHHAYCAACGTIFDIEESEGLINIDALAGPMLRNFDVKSYHLTVKGICPRCPSPEGANRRA